MEKDRGGLVELKGWNSEVQITVCFEWGEERKECESKKENDGEQYGSKRETTQWEEAG